MGVASVLADTGFVYTAGELPLLEWRRGSTHGVQAVWTSRAGGVSTGIYQSLNLGGADDAGALAENRRRLATHIGQADLSNIRVTKQVHGARIVSAHELAGSPYWTADETSEADGILVDEQLGAAIFTADCMSIVVASSTPVGAVALHAGWKGVASGILEGSVRVLRDAVGHDSDLHAAIGPSIGPCCFDASDQIALAVGAQAKLGESEWRDERPKWRDMPARHGTHHPIDPQLGLRRLFVNSPAVARRRLLAAGVSQVDIAPLCTACDGQWFSYRADGPGGGRQALVVLPVRGRG